MNLEHVKVALVDFDGTMLDSDGCWSEAYLTLCKQLSMQPSSNILNSFDHCNFTEWQELIKTQLGECKHKLLECAKLVYVKRTPKTAVLSIIRSLPIGCNVSIITRESASLVLHWLMHYNIATIFSKITSVGDERKKTNYYTHPSLLLIDDNYKHCVAAKIANATVIGVNASHSEEEKMRMRNICDFYIED